MLVLTRRANQSIIIANDIVVTVLEVRGDQVRIGIKAPKDVTVHREEVYLEIQRENREAAMRGDVAIDLPLPVPNRPAGARPPLRGAAPRAASGRPIPPPPPKPAAPPATPPASAPPSAPSSPPPPSE